MNTQIREAVESLFKNLLPNLERHSFESKVMATVNSISSGKTSRSRLELKGKVVTYLLGTENGSATTEELSEIYGDDIPTRMRGALDPFTFDVIISDKKRQRTRYALHDRDRARLYAAGIKAIHECYGVNSNAS